MPVRNINGLARGIQSILVQTEPDFELIIVDDGSTDGTRAFVESLVDSDARVRVLSLSRSVGIGGALNAGVRMAVAPWIARMDADDVAAPERLAKQLAFVANHDDVDVLGTNFVRCYEDTGEVIPVTMPETHGLILKRLSLSTALCHPSVMIRRSCFDRFGSYDEKFPRIQDYELWIRWREHVKFHNLQEPLLHLYSTKVNWHRTRATTPSQVWRLELKIRWRAIRQMTSPGRDLCGLVLSTLNHGREAFLSAVR